MKPEPVHPELRAAVRFLPTLIVNRVTLRFIRRLMPLVLRRRASPDVLSESRMAGKVRDGCILPGAYHGFDIWVPASTPAQAFHASQVDALRKALAPQPVPFHRG